MATENVQRASEGSWLWPPIADAVDTFLRRRATGSGPYERIWRLIHVWEATSITLAAAAISYVRESGKYPEVLRRLREFCHGRSWKPIDKTFERQAGALAGSVDRWIDILFEFANHDYPDSAFLSSLKRFLETDQVSLSRLVTAWAVTCAVPTDSQRADHVPVKQALRNINIFRNRFAHVPFPHDPLDVVAGALEELTEQLFSIPPLPWKIFPNAIDNSPLVGALLYRDCLLRGCNLFHTHRDPAPAIIQFAFPCPRSDHEDPADAWRADPFVFLDTMNRPFILTRLVEETMGTWEYTRFRAEANAVITRDDLSLMSFLPIPLSTEYAPDEDEARVEEGTVGGSADADRSSSEPLAAEMDFDRAIEAIRNENYSPAILFFAELTSRRPEYHIGWLRLGHAKREKAMRLRDENAEEAVRLMREAVEDLTRATGHRDAPARAQAFYELSKVHHHLARWIVDDASLWEAAQKDATQACELATDPRYRSWLEYLDRSAAQRSRPTAGEA